MLDAMREINNPPRINAVMDIAMRDLAKVVSII
jgi:hypothetical protein